MRLLRRSEMMRRTSFVVCIGKYEEYILQKGEVVGLEEGIGCGGSGSHDVVDKLCANTGEQEKGSADIKQVGSNRHTSN